MAVSSLATLPPRGSHQTFSDEEKQYARVLIAALEPFRALRADMPLHLVHSFLLVALNEGDAVSNYAEEAGMSVSVMARQLLDLGDRNRYKGEGFGLVEQKRDPNDLRSILTCLSSKGKTKMREVIRALSLAPRKA